MSSICALATASGGALAVIRVSGKDAISIVDSVCSKSIENLPANTVTYTHIKDENNSFIDEVLVSIFRAPHSYTGENSVEISCHGSTYIINKVLSFGKAHSKIMIFSHQSDKIKKMLLTEYDAGLTLLKGESGYYEEDMNIIVTITSYDKITQIKKAVYNIDPFAFVVIEDVHSVLGKGYTISREKDPS